mmetsp:Transcript_32313/g.68334  ORF Transcript_32313/g.68334 Transcript_32313/m.68334 type:complete len:97 (+) Transcript_32313:565-855(+)
MMGACTFHSSPWQFKSGYYSLKSDQIRCCYDDKKYYVGVLRVLHCTLKAKRNNPNRCRTSETCSKHKTGFDIQSSHLKHHKFYRVMPSHISWIGLV